MKSGVASLLGAVLAVGLLSGSVLGLDSYTKVKRLLFEEVFQDRRLTLYCNCPFDAQKQIDSQACGYKSQGNEKRASRAEVEHVIPASWIGNGRACWHQTICKNGKGRFYKGRKCCQKIDPAFRAAYQDLHNLWPSVGEVNQQRQNYAFGLIPGEERAFGRCDVEITSVAKIAEPRPEIRGDVARIAFYMADTHGIWLRGENRRLLWSWHLEDPVDAFEKKRDRRIQALQGTNNLWVR